MQLHPLQFSHHIDKAQPPHHVVTAHAASADPSKDDPVGILKWHAEATVPAYGSGRALPNTITDIHTEPALRRKGIATGMWNFAHEAVPGSPPKHSPSRTREGNEWSKKAGGPRPLTAEQFSLMYGK